ncbi:MAG: hypothetical protein N2508_09830 [Anaerolineae bacterium]|nr:hypothetical protein [Anaerolineae bacterium]
MNRFLMLFTIACVVPLAACGTLEVGIERPPTSPPSSTTIPPAPSPTAEPTVPTTPGDDWALYANPVFGYQFYYPPEATIGEAGVISFPTEELPVGKTADEYMAELQAKYGNALCVSVQYGAGYVTISAPANREFRYTLCGRTGVGVGTMVDKNETLTIAGSTYTATGYEFMGADTPCETLACHNETMRLELPDGTRIEFGAAPLEEVTYADYQTTTRPVLLQIVSTFTPGP